MQKTAYEMRISDWSSDVCSSDLSAQRQRVKATGKNDDADCEAQAGGIQHLGRLLIEPQADDQQRTRVIELILHCGMPDRQRVSRQSCAQRVRTEPTACHAPETVQPDNRQPRIHPAPPTRKPTPPPLINPRPP